MGVLAMSIDAAKAVLAVKPKPIKKHIERFSKLHLSRFIVMIWHLQ
jgi:hypothetical protein